MTFFFWSLMSVFVFSFPCFLSLSFSCVSVPLSLSLTCSLCRSLSLSLSFRLCEVAAEWGPSLSLFSLCLPRPPSFARSMMYLSSYLFLPVFFCLFPHLSPSLRLSGSLFIPVDFQSCSSSLFHSVCLSLFISISISISLSF